MANKPVPNPGGGPEKPKSAKLDPETVKAAIKKSAESTDKDFIKVEKPVLDQDVFYQIALDLSTFKGITLETGMRAIYYLFLLGAANRGTPDSLTVTMQEKDCTTQIRKGELKFYYENRTSDTYLRRLAESVADEISIFAERNNLSGDLAQKIDKQLRAAEPDKEGKRPSRLTAKEKAWCSSFNQDNPTLDSDPELKVRLGALLTADLNRQPVKTKQPTKPPAGKKTGGKTPKGNGSKKQKGKNEPKAGGK